MGFAKHMVVPDLDLDLAIDDFRHHDAMALTGILAIRSGLSVPLVERVLTGEDDKPCALIARAADLGWDEYQTVVFERARKMGRKAGSIASALKIYRDTSRERALDLLGTLSAN